MEWISFIQIIAIPALTCLAGLVYKVNEKIDGFQKDHNNDLRDLTEKHKDDLDLIRSQQAAWQLEVVRNYVTRPEIERLEQRIVTLIERIETKMEKYFNKSHGEE